MFVSTSKLPNYHKRSTHSLSVLKQNERLLEINVMFVYGTVCLK